MGFLTLQEERKKLLGNFKKKVSAHRIHCYSNVLFGIGKIRVIAIATMTEAVVYIPLAVALGHRFGLYGIVGALLIVNLLCAVCNKIQFNKLASGTATGIWNK